MGNILQKLRGIRVSLLNGPVNPNVGEAFGAFITSADCKLGFNGQATEINLSLVHESSRTDLGKTFDPPLNKVTLSRSLTQMGGVPNGYRIEFLGDVGTNPIAFEPMFLYSYDTNLETDSKTSSVVFKDYSAILNKIYIGLAFRQFNAINRNQKARIEGEVLELCSSCGVDNDLLFLKGFAVKRDIKMSSCFFNNQNTTPHGNVYATPQVDPPWRDVIANFYSRANGAAAGLYLSQSFIGLGGVIYPRPDEISINGGALYIGTEQFKEEPCGGISVIDYSFSELLGSLVINGLRIRNISFVVAQGTFAYQAIFTGPMSFSIDRNPRYRQNYTGTLKEVLDNWCSDMGLNYHFYGTELVFTDASKPLLDINSNIKQIFENPDFEEGNRFVVNSYKSSASLDGTYVQGVITNHTKASEMKESSKTVNYQVGFLPLHPVALYTAPYGSKERFTIFNEQYFGPEFVDPSSSFASNSREWFTNRKIKDVDNCIALGKYSTALRNIYCAEEFNSSLDSSHLGALGFFPTYEFTGTEMKQTIINVLMQGGTEQNQQNIVLLEEYFRVLIGYHYPTIQAETLEWEKNMAEVMYSYGILLRGTQTNFPYVAEDKNKASISDSLGYTSYFKITKDFTPGTERYEKRKNVPFKDAIPLSGFGLHTGYYIAKLENEWGTTQEQFNKILTELGKGGECNKYFGQTLYDEDKVDAVKPQNWSLEDFQPKFYGDLSEVSTEIREQLETINLTDASEVLKLRKTTDLTNQNECKKLHICIIPLTATHPNIKIQFKASIDLAGKPLKTNPLMLQGFLDRKLAETRRRAMEDVETECDFSMKRLACESGYISQEWKLVNGNWTTSKPSSYNNYAYSPRGVCAPDPSRTDRYWDGFDKNLYKQNNSRYLTVNITRNPNPTLQNQDRDGDGYVQLSDFISLSQQQTPIVATPFVIVYPVGRSSNSEEIYYSGILTATMSQKTKMPEREDVYGTEEIFDTAKANIGYASIKIVNQPVDPDLAATIDPNTREYTPQIYDLSQNTITSIEDFHNLSKSAINGQNIYTPLETINLTFGGLALPPNIRDLMTPIEGLSSLSLKVGDNGEFLEVTFQSRPAEQPKQEAILNKIKHRIT